VVVVVVVRLKSTSVPVFETVAVTLVLVCDGPAIETVVLTSSNREEIERGRLLLPDMPFWICVVRLPSERVPFFVFVEPPPWLPLPPELLPPPEAPEPPLAPPEPPVEVGP